MFIDSHAHIDYPDFEEDLDDIILRAKENSVLKIINVGTTLDASKRSIRIAEKYPGVVFPTAGIHPHDVEEAYSFDEQIQGLEEILKGGKVVAVGECGVDYGRLLTNDSKVLDQYEVEKQKDLFIAQMNMAEKYDLPVIVHTRMAEDDSFEILYKYRHLKGVIHCYTGSLEFARKVLDLGFYIGFTGIVTFPKNDELLEVIERVPLDKLLIETDCPYISPVPYRGQRNEPAYVIEVAKKVAEVKEVSLDEIARKTSRNAEKLFGI